MPPAASGSNLPSVKRAVKQERKFNATLAFVFFISLIVASNVYESAWLDTFHSLQDSVAAGQAQLSLPLVLEDYLKASSSTSSSRNQSQHYVAGLSCQQSGGPPNDVAAEMVYWKDIPSDAVHVSPLKHPTIEQYLTFEPDEGGWNNIRMALETAVTMAIAMGRTLVVPPEQRFYLLDKFRPKKQHKTAFSFADFYHFDSVMAEHIGFKVISFDEFIETVAMKGLLKDKVTGQVSYPPENRTDWNNLGINWQSAKMGPGKILWGWLRSVTTNLEWQYGSCVAAFPSERGPEGVQRLQEAYQRMKDNDEKKFREKATKEKVRLWKLRLQSYDSNPTPVDAPPEDRLAEMIADRTNLCIYDESMQNDALVVHMKGEQQSGHRMLVHFYAFLFFDDWKQDLWIKRFVRDHMRYIDDIQCAAARVVAAVRERAKNHSLQALLDRGMKLDNIDVTLLDTTYDSMHIRRGDFQYQDMHMSALDIYNNNTKSVLKERRTVFIATDEHSQEYFEPLREHYHIYFLDDFKKDFIGPDLNPNYYGMVDQLVASRGQTFFGAFFSTFTGFINRMRGYHSQNSFSTGYEHGIIDSFYYTPDSLKYFRRAMRSYHALEQGFWRKEFPVCWRDIDRGVGTDDTAKSRL